MGLTVALCFNLGTDLVARDDEPPDSQAELDTERTISAICSALDQAGHTVVPIEADKHALAKLDAARPDIVFNIAEGLGSESRESFIPAICNHLEIPYTGSGVLTLSLALDKGMTKRVFAYEGVPTPPFRVIRESDEIDVQALRYPLFVKPLREGSSMGITERSRAENLDEVRDLVRGIHYQYRQPALVEEFLDGREFTVGILGNRDVEFFPIMEINYAAVPTGQRVYSRHFKEEWFAWDYYLCPAPLSELEARRIQDAALGAFRAVGARDFARVDVRYDRDGQPCVLEINPICGLSPEYGDYPKLAEKAGYSFPALINAILDTAVARYAASRQRVVARTGS